ncbi:YeiH family protein [Acetobacter sp. DsW_54]|uniref:YeiH family protein n=1 Tax=Acetobacter sp. DsW_54 TaxID=1670660 RepID=UPI000A3931C3|nr:putative sulfate exporter family transporter [Acetobacter sp. DsW_54]OUI99702.1 membrane protein [Acetobacter sp. DsW_54]
MTAHPTPACMRPLKAISFLRMSGPGVLLCLLVSGLAIVLEGAETHLLGKAWLESLNLALLLGVLIRAIKTPGPIWTGGIRLCARPLLNVAIVCLGASFSLHTVFSAGPALLLGVMGIVLFSVVFTLLIGRAMGLPTHQLLLVACGNAICGNSAIMAAAPVIGAKEEDIGTTIAFTAAGGLVVVLGLPLLAPALLGNPNAQGVLAGLTVYAVPQVVAAAAPFGQTALHVGTLVKLMRVLMLGPVCLALAVFCAKPSQTRQATTHGASIPRLVPWYIAGFAAMMTARSCNLVPDAALTPLSTTATCLTTMAMAALGLSVELRSVLHAGRPLALSVFFSLLGLVGASLILVRLLFGA